MTIARARVIGRRLAGLGRLGLLFAVIGAVAGCARDPVQPASLAQDSSAQWFAAAEGSDVGGSYDPYYEPTGARENEADQVAALDRWGASAAAGDLQAAYELGRAYYYGNGLPANTERAAHWLMAALAKPHDHWPHAAYLLGTMLASGDGVPQDVDLARRLLLAAADRGYDRAGLPLAQLYAEGRGVERDLARAERLATYSAESGDIESYFWLLRAYRPGGHLGEDEARSAVLGGRLLELLEARAESNDGRAMRDLAVIRYQGLGVARDRDEAMRWLERAAELQHPEYLAQFGEDIAKGRNGFAADPREGFSIMRQAANRYWYPDALSMVAEAYATGLGTDRDPIAAENWFRRAVDAGSTRAAVAYGQMLVARDYDPDAQRRGAEMLRHASAAEVSPAAWAALGKLHLDKAFPGAEPSRGIVYLERARLAGDATATTTLGKAHLEGRGVERDTDKAVALLRSAADAGQVEAMLTLGEHYYEGEVLPQDPERAKQWLQRADAAGSEEARLRLGRGLLAGELPGDPLEGLQIVASFAQARNAEAMMTLGRAMRDGERVPRDREAARRWFANAMEAGHPEAAPALAALLYEQGNRRQDLAQLEEAAELGHVGAMSRLGHAYLLGEGAPRNPVKGSSWLERAAAAGSVPAAQTLGSAYLRGDHGLSRDPLQARHLLEIAAEAGDTAAQRDLGYALVRPGDSGLQPDSQRGLRLLTAAAQKGDGQAMEMLGRVYLEGGKGISPQPENAEVWLTRAAEKGFGSVPTTPQAASLDAAPEPEPKSADDIAFLQEAAANGDPAARVRLGTLYLFGGEQVEPQPHKGEELLRPAVQRGDDGAMLALGLAYLHGSFGERRIEEGSRLMVEAARAGNPTARNVLTEAFVHAREPEQVQRAEAEAWLDDQLAGDPDAALAQLTAMLRDGLSNAPLTTSQAAETEALDR